MFGIHEHDAAIVVAARVALIARRTLFDLPSFQPLSYQPLDRTADADLCRVFWAEFIFSVFTRILAPSIVIYVIFTINPAKFPSYVPSETRSRDSLPTDF